MEGIEPRNRDVYNPVEEVNTPTFRPGESPELSEPLSNQAEKSAEQPDTDTQSAEDTITIPEKSHEPSETDGPPSDLSADNHPGFQRIRSLTVKEDSAINRRTGQTLPES